MIYQVRHKTRLTYTHAIKQARFNLRLMPATWRGQTMRNYRLSTDPAEHRRQVTSGPYWVVTTNISYKEPLRRLELASEFAMEVTAQPDPCLLYTSPSPRD